MCAVAAQWASYCPRLQHSGLVIARVCSTVGWLLRAFAAHWAGYCACLQHRGLVFARSCSTVGGLMFVAQRAGF